MGKRHYQDQLTVMKDYCSESLGLEEHQTVTIHNQTLAFLLRLFWVVQWYG